MRFLKLTFIILLIAVVIGSSIYYFSLPATTPIDQLYEVEVPNKKEVKQVISATGSLKLKDQVKIGSVVTGKVKALYVEESDPVQEGQLLVEIDTGLGDTEVREAQGAYDRAIAELEYQEANFKRKKQLFEEQFLSDADLEEARRNYRTTLADIKALKATYEKKLISFENNKVYAPASGIIIHIDVAKGEKVTSDIEGGTLLSLAPDVKQIEAELNISEKDIGQIQKGQKIQMVVDTYPNRIFESNIHNISFTAKRGDEKECTYQAKAYIDNPHLLLRPGMSVNATIDVAAVNEALTVTSRAFLIKQEHLQPIGEILKLPIKALDKAEKETFIKSHQDANVQFVWVVCADCFRETPVELGITDHLSFEIKSGLNGDEKLVVGVAEDDAMKKLYEQLFRKM
jgi:HlyD family secretion protein